jgi:predicted  nucleic acid-binding Zn-ribbon protein
MFFKPTAAKLGKKKTRILGVFTKAQEELSLLMEEQTAYNNKLVDKISELEAERKAVERENNNTQKLLKKINEFLD